MEKDNFVTQGAKEAGAILRDAGTVVGGIGERFLKRYEPTWEIIKRRALSGFHQKIKSYRNRMRHG